MDFYSSLEVGQHIGVYGMFMFLSTDHYCYRAYIRNDLLHISYGVVRMISYHASLCIIPLPC